MSINPKKIEFGQIKDIKAYKAYFVKDKTHSVETQCLNSSKTVKVFEEAEEHIQIGWAIVATSVALTFAIALSSIMIIAASTGGSTLSTSTAWAGIGGSSLSAGLVTGAVGAMFIGVSRWEMHKISDKFDPKKCLETDLKENEKELVKTREDKALKQKDHDEASSKFKKTEEDNKVLINILTRLKA